MQPTDQQRQNQSNEAYQGQKIDVIRPESLDTRHHSVWHSLRPALSIVSFIVGVIVAASLINIFIFQSYYVEGTSMVPTLQDSDRLIIDKTGHSLANLQGKPYVPARGDIIVLDSNLPDPRNAGKTEQLIKRVIGLPGERIVVKNGKATVFNKANPDGFNPDELLNLQLAATYVSEPLSITLGGDEIYVMGDNRGPGGSLDSRTFGPVNVSEVEGRLWARIFPLSNATLF